MGLVLASMWTLARLKVQGWASPARGGGGGRCGWGVGGGVVGVVGKCQLTKRGRGFHGHRRHLSNPELLRQEGRRTEHSLQPPAHTPARTQSALLCT